MLLGPCLMLGARDLELECTKAIPEALLVYVLMYGIETMIWKE